MKVLIDGVVTAERYFASEDELVQGYRKHQAQQARVVLPEVARSGGKVVLVLESAAEQRLVEQLRQQLPEVEIVVETRAGSGATAAESQR
jgi:hypothetical protein